jgi:flagellar basal-body rod protein FlgC
MLRSLDISASGLVAQRTRMDAISTNIANMHSTRNEKGELSPFQARFVVLETDSQTETSSGGVGVRVKSVNQESVEPTYKYEPNHPHAIKEGPRKGYVAYPSVNLNAEFVDAMLATRAYEANVGMMEMTKNMAQQALRILG